MQQEFERRIQLISPDLLIENKPSSDLIFSILNEAQDRFVKLNYVGDDQLPIDTNTQARSSDAIKSLLVEKELTEYDSTPNYTKRFTLPTAKDEEYFLYVHSVSKVTGTYKQLTNETFVDNQLIKYRDLPKYMTTAYNTPIVRKPAVALASDINSKMMYLEVVTDKYTDLHSIVLTYYRKPLRFGVTSGINQCELPESVHEEIVQLAVNMFITENKYALYMPSSTKKKKKKKDDDDDDDTTESIASNYKKANG